MTPRHPVTAHSHRRFGRRPLPALALDASTLETPLLSDELRLFAMTFAGGFLFMTVYLA